MHISMGIESTVLVRDAIKAVHAEVGEDLFVSKRQSRISHSWRPLATVRVHGDETETELLWENSTVRELGIDKAMVLSKFRSLTQSAPPRWSL